MVMALTVSTIPAAISLFMLGLVAGQFNFEGKMK